MANVEIIDTNGMHWIVETADPDYFGFEIEEFFDIEATIPRSTGVWFVRVNQIVAWRKVEE